MKDWLYNILENFTRLVMKRPEIRGMENVVNDVPAVFVANHAGVYGPVTIKLFFPIKTLPWVIHDIVDNHLCADYLKTNFFEKSLGWHPLISRPAACVVSKICVPLIKHIGAIPVYRMDRRIVHTIRLSVEALGNNHNLVIFIDDKVLEANEFRRGFINIARAFYNRFEKAIICYPDRISPMRKEIVVEKGICFDPNRQYRQERLRIEEYIYAHLKFREPL